MTNDSHLFKTSPGPGRLPLYEGKMIWHFNAYYAERRYWLDEKEARKAILGRSEPDTGQALDYQKYRFGCRSITGSTNERTMVCSIVPPNIFCGNSLQVSTFAKGNLSNQELLFLDAVMSSFIVDFSFRQRVATQMNMFFIYQTPVPRLTSSDPRFMPIVTRAAKLICTTPEFDDLAKAVGLRDHTEGVTNPDERAKLRAELDGLVAHLYNLTEDEFRHILGTFPLVAQAAKDAALEAFHAQTPKPGDPETARLIALGEGDHVEFKSTGRWDVRENKPSDVMETLVIKSIAGFMNGQGGNLLIGVEDDRNVLGLDLDYRTLQRKNPDGYALWLNQRLENAIGRVALSRLKITFPEVDGKTICRIEVKPSPDEVWAKTDRVEQFFVRLGNSTRLLAGRDLTDYIRHRFR